MELNTKYPAQEEDDDEDSDRVFSEALLGQYDEDTVVPLFNTDGSLNL